MSESWKKYNLGDVCEIIGGGTPSKSNPDFYGGDYWWATVRDMKNDLLFNTEFKISDVAIKKSATNIIPKGNVIIATRVGLGKVCLLQVDSAINQDLKGIIPKKSNQLISKYIFYWFKCISNQIIEKGTGATVKGVKLDFIRTLNIPIPPLTEQQHIVDILDQSFAAIDQAIENTEKNLINAKDLFLSALDQLFSNYAKTSPDRFIGDVSNVIAGQSPEGKYYNNNGIGLPFYQGKKEFTDKFLDKPTTWTTKITKEALENDILMSVRAPVGPVNIATEKICIGRGLSAIRPSKYILRDYLFYFFISNKEKLVGNSGTVFNSINKTQIEKIPIPVPPINKQHEFVNLVALLSNRVQNLDSVYSKKKNLLIELKQSILHKAFNGELS